MRNSTTPHWRVEENVSNAGSQNAGQQLNSTDLRSVLSMQSGLADRSSGRSAERLRVSFIRSAFVQIRAFPDRIVRAVL